MKRRHQSTVKTHFFSVFAKQQHVKKEIQIKLKEEEKVANSA